MSVFDYKRRKAHTVTVGGIPMGSNYAVRLQSMTSTSTMDTEASVEQCCRIAQAGASFVRLTAQGVREAENMGRIKQELLARGVDVPLVADVHFNASVADTATHYADKVRVNPGNYVDTARTFKHIDYTDAEYAEMIQKIKDNL